MATAMITETLDYSQHSRRLNPEGRSYTSFKRFTSHLKENTTLTHYKDQVVHYVKELIAVYYPNHTKHVIQIVHKKNLPINKPIEVKPTTDRNTRLAALCGATQKVYFLFFFQRSCRQSVSALQSTIRKMASPQERAQCAVWFSETKSPTTVQRNYRRVFEDPPDKKTTKAWYDKFLAAGSVLRKSRSSKKTHV
jgi:hypothetical protein